MNRPLAASRLRRMLALVPWILAHPGATIVELARRFDVSEKEIEADLALLPMCGLPPYTADRLIDVWVADDGAVSIRLAEYFDRPLRLTPSEGVALLVVGRLERGLVGGEHVRDTPLDALLVELRLGHARDERDEQLRAAQRQVETARRAGDHAAQDALSAQGPPARIAAPPAKKLSTKEPTSGHFLLHYGGAIACRADAARA